MTNELESETQDLDRWVKEQLRPSNDAIGRVRDRVHEERPAPSPAAPASRRDLLSRRALQLSAVAAVVVLSLGAGMLGSRLQPAQTPFATSVVPVQGGSGTSLSQGTGFAAQGAALQAAAAGSAAPTFYGGSCSQAPSVQIQGRGVTATGFATVAGTAGGSLVGIYIQGQGADANAATSAVQSKATAVLAALEKVGLGPTQVQQSSFNVYSGPPNQANAMVSLQARVTSSADVAKVITAAMQAGATSAYSGTPMPPDSATDADVRDAVSRATDQAKTMATATASAADVQIAQLQTVVTQPPQVCYGPSGAQRVVAVTVSYSVR